MSYCTQQDMIERYGEEELIQLTDHTGAGVIDTATITRAITDADGDIDGRLGSRFRLPITPVPKILVRIACDIARYHLYPIAAPEHVAKRYDDAIRFIDGVAKGRISIGISATGAAPAASGEAVRLEGGGSVFGRKDNSFI